MRITLDVEVETPARAYLHRRIGAGEFEGIEAILSENLTHAGLLLQHGETAYHISWADIVDSILETARKVADETKAEVEPR